MADAKQTLREAFDRILSLIPFHSEGEKQQIDETLNRELFEKLGRNKTEAGVQKPKKTKAAKTDAKTEHPFPTGANTEPADTPPQKSE
jgi:hypothetical protein